MPQHSAQVLRGAGLFCKPNQQSLHRRSEGLAKVIMGGYTPGQANSGASPVSQYLSCNRTHKPEWMSDLPVLKKLRFRISTPPNCNWR